MLVRVWWLLQFLLLWCVWLLFIDSTAWSETLVGAGAAAIGATASEAVRGVERPRFLPRIFWIFAFWRVPGKILRDTALLTRKLFRMLFLGDRRTGRFVRIPFRAGRDDARSVARRALAILYTTLPPNSIVIGIDRKRNLMLLHLLESAPPPAAGIMEGRK